MQFPVDDVAAADVRFEQAVKVPPRSGAIKLAPVMQDGSPVPVQPSILRSLRLATKRAIDILLSLAGLLCLSPVLLLVMIAIKATSRGPIFFVQHRPGLHGTMFPVFKFRSMFVDKCDVTGVAQTRQNDDRVTPLGRWMRKTSIDELPQLANVLLGHMSLVGPRPHPKDMLAGGIPYQDAVSFYDHRYAMKPGITGLAQVNGLRGPTDDIYLARQRISYDVAYIQKFTVLLDLRILVLTVWNEVRGGTGF